MLTVRDQREDVIAGLTAGADDYVAKDEAVEIILARVNRLADYRKLSAVAVINEQLAQVGRLLAGIVHEIRSPLAVIRGHAELMKMVFESNPSGSRVRRTDLEKLDCPSSSARSSHGGRAHGTGIAELARGRTRYP